MTTTHTATVQFLGKTEDRSSLGIRLPDTITEADITRDTPVRYTHNIASNGHYLQCEPGGDPERMLVQTVQYDDNCQPPYSIRFPPLWTTENPYTLVSDIEPGEDLVVEVRPDDGCFLVYEPGVDPEFDRDLEDEEDLPSYEEMKKIVAAPLQPPPPDMEVRIPADTIPHLQYLQELVEEYGTTVEVQMDLRSTSRYHREGRLDEDDRVHFLLLNPEEVPFDTSNTRYRIGHRTELDIGVPPYEETNPVFLVGLDEPRIQLSMPRRTATSQ